MRYLKFIKLSLMIAFFINGLFICSSCSNQNPQKKSQEKQYQPTILDSDKLVKCYHPSGTLEDMVVGRQRLMPFGNVLISQNGIIKAIQIPYNDGTIIWRKIVYYSIDDDYDLFKCEITGRIFDNCAKIVYLGFSEDKVEDTIYWN